MEVKEKRKKKKKHTLVASWTKDSTKKNIKRETAR